MFFSDGKRQQAVNTRGRDAYRAGKKVSNSYLSRTGPEPAGRDESASDDGALWFSIRINQSFDFIALGLPPSMLWFRLAASNSYFSSKQSYDSRGLAQSQTLVSSFSRRASRRQGRTGPTPERTTPALGSPRRGRGWRSAAGTATF